MAVLKHNIVWNLIAGVWIGVLTLILTPLQVKLLGMEAYGLIGFIAVLQIVMGVLDIGLSSTVTREIAGDSSPGHKASFELLRTATTIYWSVALLIGIIFSYAAEDIARAWFRSDATHINELVYGLQVAALILALRWPVSLYAGALTGVQRLDILNLIKAGTVSIRLLGGIIVIFVSRDLSTFLAWLAFAAALEVLAYLVACRVTIDGYDWRPGFSLRALQAVWGFSLGMSALGVLSVGLTQIDRLLVSKLLPLQELGYYALAHTTASSISLIATAFGTALMPSFAAAHGAGSQNTLVKRYESASRVLVFTTGAIFFTLTFFGQALLSIWVGSDAAAGASRTLAMLAAGYWLGAAVSATYTLTIACRRPYLSLKVSAASAIIYGPAVYIMIAIWGIEGAAITWFLLFAGYVCVMIPIVHRQILAIPVAQWFLHTLFSFALLGASTFGTAKLIVYLIGSSHLVIDLMALALALIFYSGLGFFFLGADVRRFLLDLVRRAANKAPPVQ